MEDDSKFDVAGYTRVTAGKIVEVRPHKRRRRVRRDITKVRWRKRRFPPLSRRRLNKVMRAIRWRKRQAMLKSPT